MESRPGNNQAINERNVDTYLPTRSHPAQQPAHRRTVEVQGVPDPGMDRRDNDRYGLVDEADMANESLIEDREDQLPIV